MRSSRFHKLVVVSYASFHSRPVETGDCVDGCVAALRWIIINYAAARLTAASPDYRSYTITMKTRADFVEDVARNAEHGLRLLQFGGVVRSGVAQLPGVVR